MSVQAPEKPVNPPVPPENGASTETSECGYPIPTGTAEDGRTKITKACVKPKDHEGDHSSRKYKPRTDLSVVTDDLLDTLEDVPVTEDASKFASAEKRSERQAKIDAHVKAAHEAWAAKGKSKTLAANIKAGTAKRYFIEPQNHAAVKTMLRDAGTYHGVRVHVDKPRRHTDGRTMVYWYVTDIDTAANVTAENKVANKKPAEKPAEKPAAEKPAVPPRPGEYHSRR